MKLPQKHDEVPAYRAAVEADLQKGIDSHRAKHDLPSLLVQVRSQIDEVDFALAGLLRRRAVLVEAANMAKELAGMSVHDPAREADLVARVAPTPGVVQDCYREVIRVNREHAQRRQAAVPRPHADGDAKGPAKR